MKHRDPVGDAGFPAPIGRRSLLCGLAALALLAGCERSPQTLASGKQGSAESTTVSPAAPSIRGPAVLPDRGWSVNVGNQPHTWSIAWENGQAATTPAVLRSSGGSR